MDALDEFCESNVRFYSRSFPTVFCRAKGATLWDTKGRKFIDLFAGCATLNYGHNPAELKAALIKYLEDDGPAHSLDMFTVARQDFLRKLSSTILAPRGLQYKVMFTGPTGANAIEAAIKLARKVTGRTNIVAFTNAFHGMSLGALSATGSRLHRKGAAVSLLNVDRFPYDGYLGDGIDTSAVLERFLDDSGSGIDLPAAVLIETVQGEGGLRAASNSWLGNIARIAQRFGSLIIIDEIQTGCGRTGHFFSFERSNLKPDIVCLAKALSGYGLPLSAVLFRRDLDIWEPGEHNGTFRGNNLAFVTGSAALNYWTDPQFVSGLNERISTLNTWANNIVARYPERLCARGLGLLRGLECNNPAVVSSVCMRAFQNGVLIEASGTSGEVIKLAPPLNIDPALFLEGLKVVGSSIDQTFAETPRTSDQSPA